jgi:solute carrier family 25 (mitochondrial folate transporter), member 32
VTAATIASAVSWGGYFYFYETAKKRKRDSVGNKDTDTFDHLLAGFEAGSIMVVLTNPLWLIKTRLQIQGRDLALKKYAGTADAIRTIFKEEGFQGFYKGFVPAILLTSHGAIQFAVYEYLKALYAKSNSYSSSSQPAQVSFIIGGVSKVVAATITYPYQVVKSRLQQRGNVLSIEVAGKSSSTVLKYTGTIDCLRNIWM